MTKTPLYFNQNRGKHFYKHAFDSQRKRKGNRNIFFVHSSLLEGKESILHSKFRTNLVLRYPSIRAHIQRKAVPIASCRDFLTVTEDRDRKCRIIIESPWAVIWFWLIEGFQLWVYINFSPKCLKSLKVNNRQLISFICVNQGRME